MRFINKHNTLTKWSFPLEVQSPSARRCSFPQYSLQCAAVHAQTPRCPRHVSIRLLKNPFDIFPLHTVDNHQLVRRCRKTWCLRRVECGVDHVSVGWFGEVINRSRFNRRDSRFNIRISRQQDDSRFRALRTKKTGGDLALTLSQTAGPER
jgi:hypothetical protein